MQWLASEENAPTNTSFLYMEVKNIVKFNIKAEIKRQGTSIAEVSKAMGVNRNYINQINGGTTIVKLDRIAKHLRISLASLFEHTKTDTPL